MFRFLLLSVFVCLLMVLAAAFGLERPPEARAFTTISSPYFFAGANPYLTGFGPNNNGTGVPAGIAFDDGNIYVAENLYNQLYAFDLSGTYLYNVAIENCSHPIGLTLSSVSPQGTQGLYVACQYSGIKEILADGTFVRHVTTSEIPYPADMDTAANGDLLVSDGNAIYRLDPLSPLSTTNPTVCASGPEINGPDGIVIDHQTHTIYVSNDAYGNDTVARIDLNEFPAPGQSGCSNLTTFVTFPHPPNPPNGTQPDGIAIGLTGICKDKLYVNANNGLLYEVTISTKAFVPIASGTERGDLVEVSDDGFLFATQTHSVAKIGPNCFQSNHPCVTIHKATDPAGGMGFGFTRTVPGGPQPDVYLDHGGAFQFCDPGTYIFSEPASLMPPGWTLTYINCAGSSLSYGSTISFGTAPSSFPHNYPFFVSGDTAVKIILNSGDHVTCTFKNDQGSIRICKTTNPPGGTGFNFSAASGLPLIYSPFPTLGDGDCETLSPAPGGTYYFEESPLPGWNLVDIICTGGSGGFNIFFGGGTVFTHSAFETGDTGVKIDLAPGQHVSCTFRNSRCLTDQQYMKVVSGDPGVQRVYGPGRSPAVFPATPDSSMSINHLGWNFDPAATGTPPNFPPPVAPLVISPPLAWLDPLVESPFKETGAKWISFEADARGPDYFDAGDYRGVYLYRVLFNLPLAASAITATAAIAADNYGWLYISNQGGNPSSILSPSILTSADGNYLAGNQSVTTPAFNSPLGVGPGANVLGVEVHNWNAGEQKHFETGVVFSLEVCFDSNIRVGGVGGIAEPVALSGASASSSGGSGPSAGAVGAIAGAAAAAVVLAGAGGWYARRRWLP